MSKENGINPSSLGEFREAARAEREKRAVSVRLPSGMVARLIRPTPYECLLFLGKIPQSMAGAVLSPDQGTPVPRSELVSTGQQENYFLRSIFVYPRVPDEAQPGVDIPITDVQYAIRWAGGEVTDDGRDLVGFPEGAPGPSAVPSSGGERVGDAAEPDAGDGKQDAGIPA
jgi:hypothetical protein